MFLFYVHVSSNRKFTLKRFRRTPIFTTKKESARLPHPLFSHKLTTAQNLKHGAFLVAPLLEALGAWLSWELYRDNEMEDSLLWAPGIGEEYDSMETGRSRRPYERPFAPYQGKAHKLGEEETLKPGDMEYMIGN